MIIYPAIDVYNSKAVRLYKGDYEQMTVYNDNILEVANCFKKFGATHIHIVDLEGAQKGELSNFQSIAQIKKETNLFCEVGGGIRDMLTIDLYLNTAKLDRVILGTAAVTTEGFVEKAVQKYGDKIAVGIDIKDGFVAIKGWTEKSDINAFDFCEKMQNIGVKTIICTDISKDGAMQGTNHELYRELSKKFNINLIASGGVSSIEDISKLKELDIHGAIIGKAYYTGAIDISQAIEVAR